MASFGRKKPHTYRRIILFTAVICAVLFLFSAAVSALSSGDTARQQENLTNALEQDITWCYASKGHYPSSLEEIRENYGLTYDEDKFLVDYQVRGANIRPDVTVIVR